MAATSLCHALSALTLGPVCSDQGSLCNPTSPCASLALSGALKSGGAAQRGRLQIRCARVGGVETPNSKRVEIALTYIHGVGSTTARQILLDVGLENKLAKELSEEELTSLRDEVSKYMIEGDLAVQQHGHQAVERDPVLSGGSVTKWVFHAEGNTPSATPGSGEARRLPSVLPDTEYMYSVFTQIHDRVQMMKFQNN